MNKKAAYRPDELISYGCYNFLYICFIKPDRY